MKDYRFILSYKVGNTEYTHYANAIFGDDLAMTMEKANAEEYYRTKLSGKVTFANADYTFIMGAAIDSKIVCTMESYYGGAWHSFLDCYFYQTDCEINADDKLLVVEPKNDDGYDAFLGAIDKEYDLIKLAAPITPISLDKRPCLQIYALSESKLSCILSGMAWEQDCKEVTDPTEMEGYGFALWGTYISAVLSGNITSGTPTNFEKRLTSQEGFINFSITKSGYTLTVSFSTTPFTVTVSAQLTSGGQTILEGESTYTDTDPLGAIYTIPMTGTAGTATLQVNSMILYGRWLTDSETIMSVPTSPIPSEDIADNNRNYTRVVQAAMSADMSVVIYGVLTETPTQWGIFQPGQYYARYSASALPVCRSLWGRASLWLEPGAVYAIAEEDGRALKRLDDAYLLTDVITTLLHQYNPSASLVSTFLGNTDPLDSQDPDTGLLYITPKSNILKINYTQPAQKAPITLREVLDMLRTTYKCYWTLEGANLRIEHIEYFRRGGQYSGSPVVGANLTTTAVVRTHKKWDYLTTKYTFDKINMPCQMEFAYADNSTEPFVGLPMVMESGYVDMSRVDKKQVAGFSADVDYLMLNPSDASQEGFVVMRAIEQNSIENPIRIAGEAGDEGYLMRYRTNGEQVRVKFNCTGAGRIEAISQPYSVLSVLQTWSADGSNVEATWNLPPNTDRIQVVITSDGYFELTEFYTQKRKVKYWDWVNDGVHHVLQNGTLSFSYLHRYYAYDLPCRYYKIGNVDKVAIGIAKNKVQEVTFPTNGTFDANKVVTTPLGNGKLRKLSLNLSSKGAKATLEYDTE